MQSRMIALHVFVVVMLVVLAGRLWQVQVMRGQHFVTVANKTQTRAVVVPAVRGQILDAVGRPLVRNRTSLVVSVDTMELSRMPDKGKAVIGRLAELLGRPAVDIQKRVRLCGPKVSRPCWPGSPYQPVPVDDHVSTPMALQLLERQEEFPGVSARVQAVRDYPLGDDGAQMLGYLQPVTQQELERRVGLKASFSGVDLVGRSGLEAQYDEYLRGKPGVRAYNVDRMGKIIGTESHMAPTTGDTLVTSIDARVQASVDAALDKVMRRAKDRPDGAAGVVLDVKTGRVIALSSLPTYNPKIWIGGISDPAYQRLLSEKNGKPLTSRATNGELAPGSTFKVVSVAGAVKDGYPLHGTYDCPGTFRVGNREFRNFEGVAHGRMNLHQALVVSCDTIFYRFAYEQWQRDGGIRPRAKPRDPLEAMSRAFGFGRRTGIDLPNEADGRIPSREWKRDLWEVTREENCRRARTGYPEVHRKDPTRAVFLKRLAAENCKEGYVWRPGDAANFSIGQGDVLVTPLQLAVAYAALVGDGRIRSPRIARALVRPDGRVVKEITPPVVGRLPVSDEVRDYMRRALADVTRGKGTAAGPFSTFPLDRVHVAGKTGTAEVYGKRDTAWFASFAPAQDPRFVVVVMVSQGGMGGGVAAPIAREIWESIYGVGRPAAMPGGVPPSGLPAFQADGTVRVPPDPRHEAIPVKTPRDSERPGRPGRPGDQEEATPPRRGPDDAPGEGTGDGTGEGPGEGTGEGPGEGTPGNAGEDGPRAREPDADDGPRRPRDQGE
ncbi:penicillin-binding protein 2 [Bailinhaonella thermotolerans]|uniref:Penicillin-binding protein 2 n=1 Tax=Bailinhaonella thermotolerans TaxID=1070861 RepID=A0A3A4B9X7_9ACTN|nr:penicillin-binding protein 2 [Bailinhaonella thermotolerans]RJL34534.1 penicillin-binding protein 2 [Bailinhaonella thermotolerans]